MPPIGTEEQRARASRLVHRMLIVKLWTQVVPQLPDPESDLRALSFLTTLELERALEGTVMAEGDVMPDLALAEMDWIWSTVRRELGVEPSPQDDAIPRDPKKGDRLS